MSTALDTNRQRQVVPTGKTAEEWRAIENAAIQELQRRADEAHATVVALLDRHGSNFSAKQMSQIRRRLEKR
ncbi:hypothetical protein QE400_002570 [Xanthomonas sacchari]|uniref:hypothetical protein n=1 Tax=Xanthomonas sacchari TaxID=56458 RepID=UPI00278B48B8|nr:hypothetical protein [Xanthomonas sacchari]MDQ1093157.1 hypothetical protein [Xanthomonas sacchari]